jgi:hypothetical protein
MGLVPPARNRAKMANVSNRKPHLQMHPASATDNLKPGPVLPLARGQLNRVTTFSQLFSAHFQQHISKTALNRPAP